MNGFYFLERMSYVGTPRGRYLRYLPTYLVKDDSAFNHFIYRIHVGICSYYIDNDAWELSCYFWLSIMKANVTTNRTAPRLNGYPKCDLNTVLDWQSHERLELLDKILQ